MNEEKALELYTNLIPMVQTLYLRMESLARTALLPLFLLSIAFAYTKDFGLKGAVFSRLRNLLWTAFLLLLFPHVAAAVRMAGQEIAISIDNMQGMDQVIKAAEQKVAALKDQNGFNFVGAAVNGILVWLTYFILYLVHYLMLAFYQFYWSFLYTMGPLFILGSLFKGGTVITKNLFKSLILISAWPIVWAILSALLKGLPFANAYAMEGNYLTVCSMNLIFAISMLASPFLLSMLVEGVGEAAAGAAAGHEAFEHLGVSTISKVGKTALLSTATRVGSLGKAAVSTLARKTSGAVKRKVTTPPASAKLPCIIFLACAATLAHAGSSANVRDGHATRICLVSVPRQVVLSSTQHFDITKAGSDILVSSTGTNHKATLKIYYGQRLKSIDLTSDPALPHDTRVDCSPADVAAEQKLNLQSYAVDKPELKTDGKLAMRVTLAQWSNATRDYFNVMVEMINDDKGPLQFEWDSLCIKQGENTLPFSRIDAKRPFLPASARMAVHVEFTQPSLKKSAPATLQVQTNKGLLTVALAREYF